MYTALLDACVMTEINTSLNNMITYDWKRLTNTNGITVFLLRVRRRA
jgi:hypothetical protein